MGKTEHHPDVAGGAQPAEESPPPHETFQEPADKRQETAGQGAGQSDPRMERRWREDVIRERYGM
jgi:hypothetical protein